jgi:hypothetical protein
MRHTSSAFIAGRELGEALDIATRVAIFYGHVLEFTGFKNLATFETFDKFGVFFTGHDLHARMLTLIHFASLIGDWRRRGWSHNPGKAVRLEAPGSEIWGILALPITLSSTTLLKLTFSVDAARLC